MFIEILLSRLLFIACMVFILGYIFGNFSASKTLTRITKVAAVLAIVLFITGNVFMFRGRNWRYTDKEHTECYREKSDSTHAY
ncbi:hypothetical protein [Chitinophaga sp.]|uniref:hypothetical protein n=1 Tax=Chitinophaga sp. TaxID=1869181 RepID=UPI0031DB9B6E